MSVKGKVKRCNKLIEKLNNEVQRLKKELRNSTVQNSNREQLQENIIKFAITNHVGGLRSGMQVDKYGIDKMNDLKLDIDYNHFENSYIIKVNYKY